jgi:hypothetical protein
MVIGAIIVVVIIAALFFGALSLAGLVDSNAPESYTPWKK